MSFSIWEKQSLLHPRELIVIGAGLVGLQTAIQYKLMNPKSDILILEASPFPVGASSRNAGFACFGSISEILDDIKAIGVDNVHALISDRWQGLQVLRETLGDAALDYQELGGFEFFKNSAEEHSYIAQIDYANEVVQHAIGKSNTYLKCDNFQNFNGANLIIKNQYEGQIDTGKMYAALSQKARSLGIHIFNGWRMTNYQSSSSGSIEIMCEARPILKAKHLVIATNAFTPKIFPDLDIKPGRNQVMVTKPISNLKIKGCFHFDKGFVYFRNYQNRLIIGGGRNIDLQHETTDELGITKTIQDYIRALTKDVILHDSAWEEDYWWSGIIATGQSKAPIIEEIDANVYVAARLGGMGVALGSLIGLRMAKLLSN